MDKIRWGIISTGGIAHAFARGLRHLPDAEIVAVGSRSQASADEFGDQYGIANRYDSYEALVADERVDVVYIGTPHAFHADNMRLALGAGKHVLCEKAFTINAAEAAECIALARERGLFLMEAMWTRYIPAIVRLREWIRDGLIGEPRMVQAGLNVDLPYDPQHRVYNPELGGGAMLDVGIYPIAFACMILGLPQTVSHQVQMGETGVDEHAAFLFGYDDGRAALLSFNVRQLLPNEVIIKGTRGYIRVHPPMHHPTRLTLYQTGGDKLEDFDIPYESSGLNYEAAEVHRCLRAGLTESDAMPLDETLAIMRLMDAARADWGLVYPNDK